MLNLIMPVFLTVLFATQDMVVGTYGMSQRAIFASIIIVSACFAVLPLYKEYKVSQTNADEKESFIHYLLTH